MDIDKYCNENYIPKPYQYCKSILNKIIKHNIYILMIFSITGIKLIEIL